MHIIKSFKYLGDTIHAYFAIKTLNMYDMPSKLYTKNEWNFLFDSEFLADSIMPSDTVLSLDEYNKDWINYIPNRNVHARQSILNSIICGIDIQVDTLNIPKPIQENKVVICNRSSKRNKMWDGDWTNIINHLKKDYKVIEDSAHMPLSDLVNHIISSKFIISVDTACVHIADAYNIPIIGLYGTTSVKRYGPRRTEFCIERMGMRQIKEADIMDMIAKVLEHE